MQLLEAADKEAHQLKDEYISVEHLMLALCDDTQRSSRHDFETPRRHARSNPQSSASQIRGKQRVTSQDPEATYEALKRYGKDLTEMAAKGKLDPVIGRDDEIRRVMQVLVPADQEQSGAGRRTRGGQNG